MTNCTWFALPVVDTFAKDVRSESTPPALTPPPNALADALTYGLEYGYNDISASVGLASRSLTSPSGATAIERGASAARRGMPAATQPYARIRASGQTQTATQPMTAAPAPAPGPTQTAVTPASATTTPAPAPVRGGARPIVFVGVTAAAIVGVYLFRRAQHRQYRDNPELPYGNPPPRGL